MQIACQTMRTASAVLLLSLLIAAAGWLLLPEPLSAAVLPEEGQELQAPAANAPPEPAMPPFAAELPGTTSLFLAVVKAMAALLVVLGLFVLMARWLKRLGWGTDHPSRGTLIKVLETRMIAPKKYVAVLQVANELLVVGVTEQQINLLAKLEQSDSLLEALGSPHPGGAHSNDSFAVMLRKACSGLTSSRRS